MKTDTDIRDDVVEELRWDPQVSQPEDIGVAVADAAVTLSGHTTSYAEKLAAGRAAERVYGVKAVANDLKDPPGRLAAGRRRHRQGDRPCPGMERQHP